MKKRITLAGYFGMGNLGDELILSIMLKNLRSGGLGGDCDFCVLSGNPKLTSQHYSVNSKNRYNPFSVLRAIFWCRFLMLGAGGIFQDKTSSASLYYYLLHILAGKLVGKKVFVYAVGIDKLSPLNGKIARRIIQIADFISVRDSISYDFLCSDVSANNVAVLLSADPVLTYTPPVNDEPKKKQPVFAFILSDIGALHPDSWASIADSCASRFGAEIKLLIFHKLKDTKYNESVLGFMRNKAEIISWQRPDDILDIFHRFDMVISTRLHGMILSAVFGKPLCGLSNDMKADLFLKEIEQKNIFRTSLAEKPSMEGILSAAISDSWRWRDEFKQRCQKNVQRLRKRAALSQETVVQKIIGDSK